MFPTRFRGNNFLKDNVREKKLQQRVLYTNYKCLGRLQEKVAQPTQHKISLLSCHVLIFVYISCKWSIKKGGVTNSQSACHVLVQMRWRLLFSASEWLEVISWRILCLSFCKPPIFGGEKCSSCPVARNTNYILPIAFY